MKKLLELAKNKSDSVEIYSLKNEDRNLGVFNNIPKDIKYTIQSGVSLRILKDGKEGFAYTKDLKDRNRLIDNALLSLKGEVEGEYSFAEPKKLEKLDNYSKKIKNITSKELVEQATRISNKLDNKNDKELMVNLNTNIKKIRILNSNGIDYKTKISNFTIMAGLIFKGSITGIMRANIDKKFKPMPDNVLKSMKKLYNKAKKQVVNVNGKMDVLFMPNSSITYLNSILSGLNAINLYKQVSPLEDKLNKQVFSYKLTLLNDPLNDKYPKAREFDDEGVASKKLNIIKNGVFKNSYNDLNFSSKLDMKPTSTGYKTQRGSGDIITKKPSPNLKHLFIEKGNKSLKEMIASIDKGVIVEGALGAGQGNIKNGDFSIGVNPGLYVENGKIIGQLKDAMVAGNIYEVFNNIKAVGNKLHPVFPTMIGMVPAILCENVSVSS